MKDGPLQGNRIQDLTSLIAEQALDSLPPVNEWNPPHCGDIGLAIRADGTWSYQGSPIQRRELVKLFSRILRRDPDGKHYLVTPAEKINVDVADAPFLAVEMQAEGLGRDQNLIFRTNIDDIVQCGPENPLRFTEEAGHGFKPYILVRGRLEALLTRSICYDLVELAQPDGDKNGVLCVWSAGHRFPLTTARDNG